MSWDEDEDNIWEEEGEACCMECKKCGYHKPSCSQYDEDDD